MGGRLLGTQEYLFLDIFCYSTAKLLLVLLSLYLGLGTPQNGLTHPNNSSAISRRIVWVCSAILWGWRLKGWLSTQKLSVKDFWQCPKVSSLKHTLNRQKEAFTSAKHLQILLLIASN